MFYSKDLKKGGKYTFEFIAKKIVWKENRWKEEVLYRGTVNVSIKDSNIVPDILENKKIYKIGEVIEHKPMKNLFVYKVEYKDSIKVWKCSKPNYDVFKYCYDNCKSDIEKYGKVNYNILLTTNKCFRDCYIEQMNRKCTVSNYRSPENSKFVVVHYGLAVKNTELEKHGIKCPEPKDDNVLIGLFNSGFCAIPLTLEAGRISTKVFFETYEQIYPFVNFMSSLMLGFVGKTDYEIVVIDSWDRGYRKFFPKRENESYYYIYTETGAEPYIYLIPKEEEAKYIVGKRATSGLLFFIIPVKKENVLFGVEIS